jgi:hypothetical protein
MKTLNLGEAELEEEYLEGETSERRPGPSPSPSLAVTPFSYLYRWVNLSLMTNHWRTGI